MTDLTLLLVGSGVFSLFLTGCYVAVRESFSASGLDEVELELNQSERFKESSQSVKPAAHDKRVS